MEVTLVELCLKLGPVYSRQADAADLAKLQAAGLDITPVTEARFQLRHHQAQTWLAYASNDYDVIFDTALTGDGKSLAGQLPLLTDPRATAMLLYPTNELIEDQYKGVLNNLERFKLPEQVEKLTSERIGELVEQTGSQWTSRVNEILTAIDNNRFILSNPDLFHLFGSFNYSSPKDRRELAWQIPTSRDYILFDEFHIFGPPQVISVMNILNFQRVNDPGRRLKYLFLSATPSQQFRDMLDRSGFRVKMIGLQSAGNPDEYYYSPAPGKLDQTKTIGFDRIVEPINMYLHSLSEKGAYQWAEQHLDEVEAFYRDCPTAKGVFIVNSVATAKRLVDFYRARWGAEVVGEVTGLTSKEERVRAMLEGGPVRLIIATSTVDIGVDFNINLLIFESVNAGTFVQRLGRLGRIGQKAKQNWPEYRAYALLPQWQVERLAAHYSEDQREIERLTFLKIVRGDDPTLTNPIFQAEQEFRHYAKRWGSLQTAHIVNSVQDYKIGGHGHQTDLFAIRLREQYDKAYGQENSGGHWIGGRVGLYRSMAKDSGTESSNNTTKPRRSRPEVKTDRRHLILKELNSFRGSSPLDCGIYDRTDGKCKKYNLFFLLANTRFRTISEDEFRQRAGSETVFKRCQSRDLKLYVELESYGAERENFELVNRRPSLKGKVNHICVLNGFRIGSSPALARQIDDRVNEALQKVELVCLILEETPKEFKAKHNLGRLFPAYSVKEDGGRGREYGLIFGQPALLAQTLVFWKAAKDDDEILIC